MPKNKVKFNLKNVHYARLTLDESNVPSYAAPVPIPGAVSLSLDANGEPENFYADGIAYYVMNNNMGYDGDLEVALIPESFRTDIMHEYLDEAGVLIETTEAELEHFALLFEFDGDKRHIRHVLYNCTASRPGIEGSTNEESREVQTETLNLSATPLPDGKVKGKTGDTTDDELYNHWYESVHLPGGVAAWNANLAMLSIGSLTLTPEFDAGKTLYTVTTENNTNTVTAEPVSEDAYVTILVNGEPHTGGNAATWAVGENDVIVVVTNGEAAKTYRVIVTKTETMS